MMKKLCCISLTLASRIIAAFGLSASILMINIVMSDFFSRKEDGQFLSTIETWALFGLNWTQFVRNTQLSDKVRLALLCFLGYSMLLLLASAFLALGTVSRRPNYAIPWLYLQMISIIDQTVSVCIGLTHETRYNNYERSTWYIPLSSLYLMATVYCWMIVYSARQEWYKYVAPYDNFDVLNVSSTAARNVDFNVPKTPSFVAQNHSIFDTPPPHIPIKYDVV